MHIVWPSAKNSSECGNKICYHYQQENVVCPPQLKGDLFTTAEVDNIDHNPSSTISHDSFHATGISLFQHPDEQNNGVQRAVIAIQDDTHRNKTKSNLPESYTCVPLVVLYRQYLPVPKLGGPNCEVIPQEIQKEYRYNTYEFSVEMCTAFYVLYITSAHEQMLC